MTESRTPEQPTPAAVPGPVDPRERRRRIALLLGVAAVCLAAFAGLATVLMTHGWTSSFDQSVIGFVRSIRAPWLTRLMWAASLPGDPPVIAPLTLIATLLLVAWGWRPGAVLLLVTMLAEAVVQSAVSGAFARHRPPASFALIQVPTTLSFPSGHAWASLLLASVVGLVLWRTLPPHWSVRVAIISMVTVVAMLVGASRVYLGVHWPTDVAGGWLMAVVSLVVAGAIYLWVVKRFKIKERGKSLDPMWLRVLLTVLGLLLVLGLLVYDASLNPMTPHALQGQNPRIQSAVVVNSALTTADPFEGGSCSCA
jgi:undecaprenyl-diphosphatase